MRKLWKRIMQRSSWQLCFCPNLRWQVLFKWRYPKFKEHPTMQVLHRDLQDLQSRLRHGSLYAFYAFYAAWWPRCQTRSWARTRQGALEDRSVRGKLALVVIQQPSSLTVALPVAQCLPGVNCSLLVTLGGQTETGLPNSESESESESESQFERLLSS